TLPKLMGKVGRYVSGRSLQAIRRRGARWQDGYYENEIRGREHFYRVKEYIHGNPVVKGLVALPEEWEQSSAHPQHSGWGTALVWPI
ncbi:MAG TPA: hypothetical protein VLU25_02320, partial [Acidobacteriota bacterium]|nr:hypothetical protein [Acidobacteriota bacterium]